MINTAKDFLGRGWSYPVDVDKATGRIKLSEYERDITEAIGIILSTRRGERVMRPEFGSTLHSFVFENADYGVRERIRREAISALERWEPRISDIDAEVDFPAGSGNGFVVNLRYTVRSTNNPYNLVFPYFLTEGI